MSRNNLKTLWWFEPRWSAAPRELRTMRELFARRACTRILLASAAIVLIIYVIVELKVRPVMPAFQFNWFRAFAESIAMFAVFMIVHLALHIGIPPIISIRAQDILLQSGQHATILKHCDIKTVHIVLRRGQRHFMRIETLRGSRRIGISNKVSLLALHDRLGEKLVVHDRCAATRQPCSSPQ